MNRRAAVLAMLALPLGLRHGSLARAAGLQEPWTALFNGRDLTGWDTWLGKLLPGQRGNSPAEFAEPVGLNKDPRGVFSAVEVDGAPAVRISGETYGGLITRDDDHMPINHAKPVNRNTAAPSANSICRWVSASWV